MNMKRALSLLLSIMLVLTCVLPLIACGENIPCSHADANSDGKCDKCGESVTINCTTHVDVDKDNKCDNCGAATEEVPAGKANYTVSVKTAGGMPLTGVSVYIYNADGDIVTYPKSTNDQGIVSYTLDKHTGYTIRLDGVPEGYNLLDGETAETRYPMGPTNSAQIVLSSKPITTGSLKDNYSLGDVMYDFSVRDVNGTTHKLSDLLKTKKMVMLNFWYIECSWCNKEFPGLNDSYAKFTDKLEVLGINDYGSDSFDEVKKFPTTGSYADDNLLFPMCKVTDTTGLTLGKFGGTGYPTTVIIDRYGVICMIESGAIVGEAKWDKIFNYFTSDNYTQKLINKAEDLTPPEIPDVEWIGSDKIAEIFNPELNATYRPDDAEYSWNFITSEVADIPVVRPSNTSDNSYGILYADVQLKPGQAVMFDYFASCEYANDRLVIIVDGDDICSLTGITSGNIANLSDWEKCYAYVDPRPITAENKDELATYEVAFVYLKDTETSKGDDTVYLKNLRVIGVDEIEKETYIIRDAVSGPTADQSDFTTYVDYVLGQDKYYHVKNADGTEGPLLLVNFLGYTNFDSYKTVSQRVMDEGSIKVNGDEKYAEWMVFANAASNSAIYGFTPITEGLKDILQAYCNTYKNEVGKDSNDNLWLQLCTYYDAYGKDKDGNPAKHIEDPIKGITTLSAYELTFPANPQKDYTVSYSVTYDRVIMPRGYLYKFTPATAGVYRFTSRSSEEMLGWIFTGSSYDWAATESGEREVLCDFEEEERYCPALNIPDQDGVITRDMKNVSLIAYLEAGKDYYIDIAYNDLYTEGTFTVDMTYEGTAFNTFVMASPGPVTYIEDVNGNISGLVALGIDWAFKDDGYAYQVLARDQQDKPTVWGEKIYADFYYPTIPFPTQSLAQLAAIGAFNFSITALDRDAMIFLDNIRIDGKNAILSKWINEDKISNATDLWNSKNLDEILLKLQKKEDVSSYNAEDVAIAREALLIGETALKRELGIVAVGTEEDWDEYKMDEALAGNLSSDAALKAQQESILAAIESLWNTAYKMDDVAQGIYHGTGKDETATIRKYIDAMEDGTEAVERQGCVAVTEELANLLSQLFSKYVFEDVENDWLKFCFYYKQLHA